MANASSVTASPNLLEDSYTKHAALMLINLDRNTRDVCHELAQAMKCATSLEPDSIRLSILLRFLEKLSEELSTLEKQRDNVRVCLNKCIGEILFEFIKGWTNVECKQVFESICLQYNIHPSMKRFITDNPGHDVENETFLRNHLRDLFLDPCPTDVERATWIGFISLHMGTAQLAKLILLLYGPLDDQGRLNWSFASGSRSYKVYTDTYFVLARVVGSLRFIPDWTKQFSFKVLDYMSSMANGWSPRSFASLLFLLCTHDKDVVPEYFSRLHKSGNKSTVSLLMALVFVVSPPYIQRSQERLEENLEEANGALLDSNAASIFIVNIFNHPDLTEERKQLFDNFTASVAELAKFLFGSLIGEDDETTKKEILRDYHALLDGFRDHFIYSAKNRTKQDKTQC